jgi:hypothetical protein
VPWAAEVVVEVEGTMTYLLLLQLPRAAAAT